MVWEMEQRIEKRTEEQEESEKNEKTFGHFCAPGNEVKPATLAPDAVSQRVLSATLSPAQETKESKFC